MNFTDFVVGFAMFLFLVMACFVSLFIVVTFHDLVGENDFAKSFCKEEGFDSGNYYSENVSLEEPAHITCYKGTEKTFCFSPGNCKTDMSCAHETFYPKQFSGED